MRSAHSRSRAVIFAAVAIIILLLIIELLLRAVVTISLDYLSDRQEITYEYKLWQMHLFDSFMGMHQPDPQLFWRLKPNYRSEFVSTNSDGFAGPEINPKQPGEYRILFLGDSTPLGLGLPNAESSFVRQLERLLQVEAANRSITVINGSVAGYSSWQCRKLLELEGEKLEPDLVITYFGNNDPSINGYLTDQELYQQTSRAGWLNRVLAHSYIYQLLKDIVLAIKSGSEGATTTLTPRVTLTQAEENLDFISDWCENRDVALMLCSVATPDLWPPGIQFRVFATGRDSEGRLVMANEMQQDLGVRWALCLDTLLLPGQTDEWTRRVYETAYRDLGDPNRVADGYARELEAAPDNPRLLNNLAVALWFAGGSPDSLLARAIELAPDNPAPFYNRGIVNYRSDRAVAEVFLDSAKQLDNYSLRVKEGYNSLYVSFAKSRSLPVAQVDSLFADLPEAAYFVDHCHPTGKGHTVIAEYLKEIIAPLITNTK